MILCDAFFELEYDGLAKKMRPLFQRLSWAKLKPLGRDFCAVVWTVVMGRALKNSFTKFSYDGFSTYGKDLVQICGDRMPSSDRILKILQNLAVMVYPSIACFELWTKRTPLFHYHTERVQWCVIIFEQAYIPLFEQYLF